MMEIQSGLRAAAETGEFVSCDWGTTHFRLRATRAGGRETVAEFRSDQGAAALAQQVDDRPRAERFRTALCQGLEQLDRQSQWTARGESLGGPVIISGMASSSIGWHELPYAELPLSLSGVGLVWRALPPLDTARGLRPIVLVSGAQTADDVMRGEETQALGAFQLPAAERFAAGALLILPGTHSKHIQVEAGQIRGFRTCLTGELYDVLSQHSILRHSLDVSGTSVEMTGESLAAFCEGATRSAQVGLSAALFRVRTRQIIDRCPAAANRALLSGVLLGAELAYLQAGEQSQRPILLCATAPLQMPYQAACRALDLREPVVTVSPDDVERLTAVGQGVLLRQRGRL